MKLTVSERVVITSLLPAEGSFATLKILDKLRMNLHPSEKEIKEWGIVEVLLDDRIRTNWQVDGEAEIPIGEMATDIIVRTLKKRDRENTLPMQAMSAYKKFIPKAD